MSTKSRLLNLRIEDCNVTTRMIIIETNVSIDINALFDHAPVYSRFPSECAPDGMRYAPFTKSQLQAILREHPPQDGELLSIKRDRQVRGLEFSQKSSDSSSFHNSMTIIMNCFDTAPNGTLTAYRVNFKVPSSGKIQMTGCKCPGIEYKCIKMFFDLLVELRSTYPRIAVWPPEEQPSAIFDVSMTNICIELGFKLNRKMLDMYVNEHNSQYKSMFETPLGYTGVIIKSKATEFPSHMTRLIRSDEGYQFDKVPTSTFKRNNDRNITFLVFYPGRVIMSGITIDTMRDEFSKFTSMIHDAYDKIVYTSLSK